MPSEPVDDEISSAESERETLPGTPIKMELGEDEIVVPQQVTMEQIRQKIEEIKVTGVEYEEEINKENIAGLLVMNCSYIDEDDLDILVNEYFESNDDLLSYFDGYCTYLSADIEPGLYGTGSSVLPENLLFDPYLINQAELIGYYIKMYERGDENSKEYYDVLVNYLFFENNEVFTFDYNDARCEGSALVCLQIMAIGKLYDGVTEYNSELRANGIIMDRSAAFSEYINGILVQ